STFWLDVNSLNTILAIAIMFGFCNGKIILFTEINNSKRGYPTFWTAPFDNLNIYSFPVPETV
ncbi:MAG: hypothetical protein MSA60_00570, partial [Parabacteroides merdae]|nr:hypothetical protein [Parabacteroides merdae]